MIALPLLVWQEVCEEAEQVHRGLWSILAMVLVLFCLCVRRQLMSERG